MIFVRTLPVLPLHHHLTEVPLPAGRRDLAKKRWRGSAGDGQEFGFDLQRPLQDGDSFYLAEGKVYVVRQQAEDLLSIGLSSSAEEAARLGWKLGNLHIPVQIAEGQALVADDPGMRQNLDRQHISYLAVRGVFLPLATGSAHGHGHSHSHD